MELIFNKELINEKELSEYLKEKEITIPNYRCAVIALITDVNGQVLLQRRGPKSRDDCNKLADIGGAFEKGDLNFKEALFREIHEEVGRKAKIEVEKFVGCFWHCKYEPRSKKDVNWLFLVYKCKYIEGSLLYNEPGKCLGYEFYQKDKLPKSEMLETTCGFWDYYLKSER